MTADPDVPHQRSEQRPGILREALLLLLLASLTCAHGWRPGRVFVPTDLAAASLPGEWPQRPENFLLFDQASQFVPWTVYRTQRLRDGEIPLWNPHSQIGAPFLGNGQSATFFPTNLLHVVLPETWSWLISAVLRLWVGGLGCLLLARSQGLSRSAGLLASSAFLLCGFNAVWLNHPHTNVSIWLPWVLLGIERLAQGLRASRVAALSTLIGLQFLGGHPGTSIHLGLAVLLFAGWRVVQSKARVPFLGAMLLSGVLGFALAGIQWLPLLDYLRESAALELRSAIHRSPSPWPLLGLLFPYLNGYPLDRTCSPEFFQATGLPNTSELAAGHVGTLTLFLALFALGALRASPGLRPWALLAGAGLAVGCALPGVEQVVALVPGLGETQNRRVLVLVALALSLLGGAGLDRLAAAPVETVQRLRRLALRVGSFLAVAGLAGFGALQLLREPIVERGLKEVSRRFERDANGDGRHARSLEEYQALVVDIHAELGLTSLRLLIPAAVLLGLGLMLRSARSRGLPRTPTLIALACAESLLFALPYNPGAPAESYPPSSSIGGLATRSLESPEPFRIAALGGVLFPELSTAYGLSDVRGNDALHTLRYWRWMERQGQLPKPDYPYLKRILDPRPPALGLLNLRFLLVDRDGEPPGPPWVPRSQEGELAVYENPRAMPRAWLATRAEGLDFERVLERVEDFDFDPRELVLIEGALPEPVPVPPAALERSVAYERPTPETIRLRANGAPGDWLVLSEAYQIGWSAHLVRDSMRAEPLEVRPAYGILQAVHLPADVGGPVTVEFEYRPFSFVLGRWVSLLGGLGIVLAAALTGLSKLRDSNASAAQQGRDATR